MSQDYPSTIKAGEREQSTQSRTASSEPIHPRIQNFLLVWLDINLDESKENFKKCLEQLHHVVASIKTFTDTDACIDILSEIREEKVFMIISDPLWQPLISDIEINTWSQFDSIYVFSEKHLTPKNWATNILKIKGTYTTMDPIIQALQTDSQNCDRGTIPMSFSGIDPLFIYTQFLKEALLEIEDDDEKCLNDFVQYFRSQNISKQNVEKFEKEYHDHTPIWWYTGPFFINSVLNHGLRLMDTEIILKMGFFIRHLHNHIQELYNEQQPNSIGASNQFRLYRGQSLSLENFDKMKKSEGNLMSFNNFLSTSRNREVSCIYAQTATHKTDSVGILFVITIDPKICRESSIPFANVADIGYFKDVESEILFTTHTIFRIDRIQHIQDELTDLLWEVSLSLVSNNDKQLNQLVSHLREDLKGTTGWSYLARILEMAGESAKAKHVYETLLENATTDTDRVAYNSRLVSVYNNLGDYSRALSLCKQCLQVQNVFLPPYHPHLAQSYTSLGSIYFNTAEYSQALSSFERSLQISKIAIPSNHPFLATCYNNIGVVYYHTGEYSKALSSYKHSLQIMKKTLPPNHPDLAQSYHNIGSVYHSMSEYSKAISSYERALQIQKVSLPPNHPEIAASYKDIGLVYYAMGEYSKALSLYEQSLHITKIALPPDHPSLAEAYSNIGLVYHDMGEYSKAFSSYEQSLQIQKVGIPSNHPSLAGLYINIGLTHVELGEYSKALTSYEQALQIQKLSLPPNHPSLAISHNNIGVLYCEMGEYPKALSSCERALQIQKLSLPPNHPLFADSYNGIGSIYYKMGEYSKALSSYQKSLEITEIALLLNHPMVANSYNNIGLIYAAMGEYSKALSSYEQSLQIYKRLFPPNHPSLAGSYNNTGSVHYNMGEYSKALSSFRRSLEIREIALPPNHPDLVNSYNSIGSVYYKMSEYSKSLSYFEKARNILISTLPVTHPDVVAVKESIDDVMKKMK